MMLKWIETTGRSEEDAISAALFQLGLERDDVSVEVIERAKSGFLGFGSNPAKVRVSYEEENGVPRHRKNLLEEPVLAAASVSKPRAAAPAEEEKILPAAPVKKPAPQPERKPSQPQAPVEEETILAAKPGMAPPRPKQRPEQPRPERAPRPQRQPRRPREDSRLQDGDEVIIGNTPRPEPVTLTPASPEDQRAGQISAFLTGLMSHLEIQAEPQVFVTGEGNYKVVLQGENLGAIIGRRGETLDAIQQLTSYSVNRGQAKRARIHIDAEGYRAKREESLQRLAVKVAGKVVKYRKNMTLEPMNAYERHVIHTALQDYSGVSTYSTGVEPSRRIVVAYAPNQK